MKRVLTRVTAGGSAMPAGGASLPSSLAARVGTKPPEYSSSLSSSLSSDEDTCAAEA